MATAKAEVDQIHATSKIEEVPLAKLRVDYSYQRDPSESLVDLIAGDWDTVASELILVSDRGPRTKDDNVEGGLFIVNGQHRSKAAQKRGMTEVWARVIDLKRVPDPGQIEAGFRLKTNVKLSDRPLERFKAQLRAKDPESLDIVKILSTFAAEINTVPQGETGINCVSTIEQIYRLDQGAILKDTLEMIKDVYGYAGGKYTQAALLKGVCWFVEKHSAEADRSRAVSKLKGIGISALESRARTIGLSLGGSLWVNYYRAIVDLYNEQLREKHRLQWMMRSSQALSRGGGATQRA